jgi:hypothetical protein
MRLFESKKYLVLYHIPGIEFLSVVCNSVLSTIWAITKLC